MSTEVDEWYKMAANVMLALKGHREVGGVRAALYNALPLAAVERLVEKMRDFERKALT